MGGFLARVVLPSILLTLGACGGGGSSSGSGLAANPGASTNPAAPANTLATFASASYPNSTQFTYPAAGQLSVDPSQPLQWAAVPGVLGYQLQVGTSPGGNDVFDSGFITEAAALVPNLPAAGVVYARVRVIPQGWPTALDGITGFPLAAYIAFSMDGSLPGSAFIYPQPGATVDADTPISWQPSPLASSYRLTLGLSKSGSQLLDTGNIASSMRVVAGLPAGATVYATLYTNYVGLSRAQAVSFVVGNPLTSTGGMLTAARTLTAVVRAMADDINQPYRPSPLITAVVAEGDIAADCTAYTTTLLGQLADAAIPLHARGLGICFNTNQYDCHELVEIFDPDTQRWIMLDPTFGLYTLNASGQPATAAELSAAARAQAFGTLGFVYLTPAGDALARAYYLDYPLLFLNVYQTGTQSTVQPAPPLQPYFAPPVPAANGAASSYALGCAAGATSATASINSADATYVCTNGFTQVFYAYSAALDPGNPTGATVLQPRRFVFQ
jgi:hypothetical protein